MTDDEIDDKIQAALDYGYLKGKREGIEMTKKEAEREILQDIKRMNESIDYMVNTVNTLVAKIIEMEKADDEQSGKKTE